MSAVVLRCSNCGTTQSVGGECEACHEAQVRYYCTNHSPGRWLEGQVCSQCGAVYGRSEPTLRPSKPIPPSRPTSRKSTEASAPSRTGDFRSRGPWGRRTPPTPPSEDYITDETVARAKAIERLRELIGGIVFAPASANGCGYARLLCRPDTRRRLLKSGGDNFSDAHAFLLQPVLLRKRVDFLLLALAVSVSS